MTRVLFVDDEPNVLEGLRRMLRPMRHEWQMAFASGGAEALRLLESEPADVVVTDMRMPAMGGETLLEQLVERHPCTIRIVLSGHSERETLVRASALAHQYVSKPCDPDVLRAKITQALALGRLIADSRLHALVSQLKSLPATASTHGELMAALAGPAASADAVAALVDRDLSMTAKLLQLANSTYFGRGSRVSSTREATHLLGLETVHGLVRTMEVLRPDGGDGSVPYDVPRLTRHSTLVSRCAQAIARDCGADSRQLAEITTAAMLHDIGKIVLADALGSEYTDLLRGQFGSGRPVWQVEQAAFGATHAAVGACLLGLWGLPDSLVAATAWHHNPSASGESTFSTLAAVHLGNVVAHRLEHERNPDRPVTAPDTAYLGGLGLDTSLPRWLALCRAEDHRD